MVDLEKRPVRAEIEISEGRGWSVETPNVISFNVRRARGQMSATFSAAIKVPYTEMGASLTGDKIVIRAGHKGSLKTVFTGYIQKCVFTPIRTDASKVMVNISGSDIMYVLQGQKINRRLTTTRKGENPPGRWGVVNSIVKQHTPIRQRFPQKVYSKERQVVIDWQGDHQIVTPNAYRIESDPNRQRLYQVKGGLSAEQVLEE